MPQNTQEDLTERSGEAAMTPEPFWYVVISEECPVINKAIHRADVAEEHAQKCRDLGYAGVEVVALYRAPLPREAEVGLSDENAGERITDMLMECAERLGNFPRAKIDPRAWQHLLVYAPAASLPWGDGLVMLDGSPLLDYLNVGGDDPNTDDWTRGYHEARRRLYRILEPQIRALASRLAAPASIPEGPGAYQAQPDAYQIFDAGAWKECSYFVACGFDGKLSSKCRALYAAPHPQPAGVPQQAQAGDVRDSHFGGNSYDAFHISV
jgi:hypothetical protein